MNRIYVTVMALALAGCIWNVLALIASYAGYPMHVIHP